MVFVNVGCIDSCGSALIYSLLYTVSFPYNILTTFPYRKVKINLIKVLSARLFQEVNMFILFFKSVFIVFIHCIIFLFQIHSCCFLYYTLYLPLLKYSYVNRVEPVFCFIWVNYFNFVLFPQHQCTYTLCTYLYVYTHLSVFVKHFGAKPVCFLKCYINEINLKLENYISVF